MSVDPIAAPLRDDALPIALAGGVGPSSLVNTPPVAADDSMYVYEDATISVNLFADNRYGTDRDPEGGPLQVVAIDGEETAVGYRFDLGVGEARVLADGSFFFDATEDYTYLKRGQTVRLTFDYTLADEYGLTDTARVTLRVIGINDVPVAQDDHFEAVQGRLMTGDLFADNGAGRDYDPDREKIHVYAVDGNVNAVHGSFYGYDTIQPDGGGRVTVNRLGKFWFNPLHDFDDLDEGETRDISFEYTLRDESRATTTATATVTVTGLADPVAEDDALDAIKGIRINGDLFADNGAGLDRHPEGGDFVVRDVNGVTAHVGSTVALAEGGQVTVNAGGKFWFNPLRNFDYLAEGETQTVSFTYGIRDSSGGYDSATATVTITGADDPVAADDAFGTTEGVRITGNVFADNGAGVDEGAGGRDFVVRDVNGIRSFVGTTFALPDGGQLTMNAGGEFWFNPLNDFDYLGAGETETVSFTYGIRDSHGGYDTATVDIEVTGVAIASLAAQDDDFAASVKTKLDADLFADNGAGADVDALGIDFVVVDVNGDAAIVGTGYDLPGGGRLTVRADGNFTFDPLGDFDHLDDGETENVSFTYGIRNAEGAFDSATAEIEVAGSDLLEVRARYDEFTASARPLYDRPLRFDPLANDFFEVGDRPELISYSFGALIPGIRWPGPHGGTLAYNADSTFSFNPNTYFQFLRQGAEDRFGFTYVVENGDGIRSTGTVEIVVVGLNDTPIARSDRFKWSLSGDNDEMNVLTSNSHGANRDNDFDRGDTIIVAGFRDRLDNSTGAVEYLDPGTIIHPSTGGEVTIDSDGLVRLTADENLIAGDTINLGYYIEDDFGATNSATVTIDILA